ncbi:TPA: DUF3265 domain-containing protein [Vibrio parahaemolyticus]|nr:DUF3265 domain-containing protein [Vibrio parahaemolyticus]EKB7281931.1 DUF3265 domain-containing protein [Vibrio parahaemolyticus]MBE3752965.1 DUF3265 domain-containing protein [Vibrio parahaemolyticus]MBE4009521.1 DUF3265 domain-containing protein [Vibrio parahaemolyticus]MBE4295977.1 DUF3265 domain-containing protein [Vibrio parahaemolyticus]
MQLVTLLTHNNLFKSDSQRVAFFLCVNLVIKVVCGSFGIALLTP